MNNTAFNQSILKLERQGAWLIDLNKLRIMFPDESDQSLRASIYRLLNCGNLEQIAHGLYARPTALTRPRDALGTLINHLRPMELTYLSLESRLADYGVISQVPTVATFMTTGRSGMFRTPLGDIEFVHTKRSPEDILQDVTFCEDYGYYKANVSRAYLDLKRTRRNLDLVDLNELSDCMAEEIACSRQQD